MNKSIELDLLNKYVWTLSWEFNLQNKKSRLLDFDLKFAEEVLHFHLGVCLFFGLLV